MLHIQPINISIKTPCPCVSVFNQSTSRQKLRVSVPPCSTSQHLDKNSVFPCLHVQPVNISIKLHVSVPPCSISQHLNKNSVSSVSPCSTSQHFDKNSVSQCSIKVSLSPLPNYHISRKRIRSLINNFFYFKLIQL